MQKIAAKIAIVQFETHCLNLQKSLIEVWKLAEVEVEVDNALLPKWYALDVIIQSILTN